MTEPACDRLQKTPGIRISVGNFGPIEHGSIDLRPMNIFVGPSNSGKTYLAVLIYALHRIPGGFPSFLHAINPLIHDLPNAADTILYMIKKFDSDSTELHFHDLDKRHRDRIQSFFMESKFLGNDLRTQMEHCFGLESVSDLIGISERGNQTHLSLEVMESTGVPWNFHMYISDSDIHTNGCIEDFEIDPVRSSIEGRINEIGAKISSSNSFLDLFANLSREMKKTEAYYLPSDRSGILHSHRVIASSLIQKAVRPSPAPAMLSGVMADFMQWLVHYHDADPQADGRSPRNPMDEIADTLESETLDGQIRATKPFSDGYPEFVYRPKKAKRDIRLNRASSMVSELAPVILLLRNHIRAGDTLLIDEPEAHLHPAAQTEMAAALAGLVRAGVRVVITTHSDWLLQEIGNLMRAGELSETASESEPHSEGVLRPGDVGVWLFDREENAEGSTIREIPFDRVDGVQPADYEDVAERLYNRSADLQNRLEEAVARGKKGG